MKKLSAKKSSIVVVSALCLSLASLLNAAELTKDQKLLIGGLKAIEENHLELALQNLDAINVNAPEYVQAFGEIQKIQYRNNQWEKFFGYASFYRAKLMQENLDPQLNVLEALALIRHCQFEPAHNVIEQTKALIANNKKLNDEAKVRAAADIQAAESILELQQNLAARVTSDEARKSIKAFSLESAWKVKESTKQDMVKSAINNPRALRVYVKNRCEQAPVLGGQS